MALKAGIARLLNAYCLFKQLFKGDTKKLDHLFVKKFPYKSNCITKFML